MTYPDDGTIVSWPLIWNVGRTIFRFPREQYGDVETMTRGLLGIQGLFINPLTMVGLNLSLYLLRQSIRITFLDSNIYLARNMTPLIKY